MASRKGGIGLGTLALLFILVYFAWTTGALTGIMGGNGGAGNGISLDAPINVSLLNALSGQQGITGEGVEIYALGSSKAREAFDPGAPDGGTETLLTYRSGDKYFFIVCEGTAQEAGTGPGCEGTAGGTREFGADDAVRGVLVTIPFASNTQQTQHNIAITLTTNFDDGSGEDISWSVISGTESLTDSDGSTTDNDYGGDGGVGVAAETEEFTGTQTHRVTIANVNDNTGWNEAFTIPDSGNTLDLRVIIQLRNENGTGTARITDMPNLYATGGASPTNWYDLGSAVGCFQREVVGTVIKQQGVCSYSFTVEQGTYTAANAFTQVTVYLVQYFDVAYFGRTGSANPEAFLDAATTDCTFDFFLTDA